MSDVEPRGEPGAAADPRDLRCSDAERELVAEVVRQAAGDGRLTLDELLERLDVVYAARTYRELEAAVHDLPGARVPGMPAPPQTSNVPATRQGNQVVIGGGTSDSAVAIFSENKRVGAWVVPAEFASVAVFGAVELDLREASLAASEVSIQANAVFGEVKVLIGDGVTVSTLGNGVLGEYDGPHEQPEPGKPHVVVNGVALFGSVNVKRKLLKKSRR
ncbi:MAG: DUF1707 domain-containing protein [Jiangellales bacterium]